MERTVKQDDNNDTQDPWQCPHLSRDTYTKIGAWLTPTEEPHPTAYARARNEFDGLGMEEVSEPHLCYVRDDGSHAWVVGAR